MLLIATTTLVVTFMSIFLTIRSKDEIVKNGNLADLTISIPDTTLQQSQQQRETGINSTTLDANLEEYLKSNGFEFSISKNLPVSDVVSNQNFILSLVEEQNSLNTDSNGNTNIVNKLVLKTNTSFPKDTDYSLVVGNNVNYFSFYNQYMNNHLVDESIANAMSYFQYENYLNNRPWLFAELLLHSNWNISSDFLNKVIPLIKDISIPPSNEDDFNTNYRLFTNTTPPTTSAELILNTNSYFAKLGALLSLTGVNYSDYGVSFIMTQVIPLIGISANIPFTTRCNQISSYFSVLSSDYIESNKNVKSIISSRVLQDVFLLPYKQYPINGQYTNYQVYDDDTKEYRTYHDFLSWFNQLDDKYKININSNSFGIIGIGDTPNLLYPSQSASQIFVDSKNNGVAYINSGGFTRSIDGTSYKPFVYYSVRYPPSARNNIFTKNKLLSELKNWTLENYNEVTAFALNDSSQQNFIFYIWSNFLNNVQRIVVIIGITIGAVVLILALIFLALLIRSIIKQNIITFGIGLANGTNKFILALSFFPFALIPSLLFGTIGFFISFALTTPTINIISNYWTLVITNVQLYNWVWIWAAIVGVIFVLLYSLIIGIIFYLLRKNTQSLLQDTGTFKVNPLVIWTKKVTSLFKPIWSFRLTLMMSNVSRFMILLFTTTTFITICSMCISSLNIFKTSLSNNLENKKYYSSIDLYSPTINSGYYSDIPYSEIGTSQKGSFNAYDPTPGSYSTNLNYNNPLNMNSEFYTGLEYYNAMTYPYSDNKFFTSLFLTSSDLSNEINWNFQFLNNRVFNKLLLDVEINALGATINPWEFAKQIIPESVLYLAEKNTEMLAQVNFDFYYWLQEQNKIALAGDSANYINIPELVGTPYEKFNNSPIYYSTFLPNIDKQPFTLDGSDLFENYDDPNANLEKWIFVRDTNIENGNKYWVLNKDQAKYAAPSFTFKSQTVSLFVQMLTNNSNPLYQMWYKYIYPKNPNLGAQEQLVPNYNYKISSNIVPVENNDETYTYVNINYEVDKTPVSGKVVGIKPNSKFVDLLDTNKNDLKQKLIDYIVEQPASNELITYPIIINNVVAKRWGLGVNSKFVATPTNTFDRFNITNYNEFASSTTDIISPYQCQFEVIGITDTNFEEQYYTLQEYANKILGYQDFSDVTYTDWKSPIYPGQGYIPFNGIFSNNTDIVFLNNYAGMYIPSGLSTIISNFGYNFGTGEGQSQNIGALFSVILNNWNKFDQLMNTSLFVNRANNTIMTKVLNTQQKFNFATSTLDVDMVGNWMRRFIDLFESSSLLVSSVSTIDISNATVAVGSYFDYALINIDAIIAITFIVTLLVIISLIAIIVVFESQKLIAILKVLGYSDIQTAFSLAFVYYFVLVLGTLISVPMSYLFSSILKLVTFNSFNIIITPVIYWWVFIGGFVLVGGILSLILLYIYKKMKKLNPAEAIAVK
ncbi:MAG: ABC transporter permease [Ureaplasma sp.]|nr:ABC transporter permease [Ureaplasma sp.]